MSDNREGLGTADSAVWRAQGGLRKLITTYRRSGGVAVFVAAAAVALAAFSGTGSSHAAGLGKRSGGSNSARSSKSNGSGAQFATRRATDGSTGLLDEWAACERAKGDSNQADPTVEHQVIYIAVPMRAPQGWDPNDAAAPWRDPWGHGAR